MNIIRVWPRRLKNFLRHFTCNSPCPLADKLAVAKGPHPIPRPQRGSNASGWSETATSKTVSGRLRSGRMRSV